MCLKRKVFKKREQTLNQLCASIESPNHDQAELARVSFSIITTRQLLLFVMFQGWIYKKTTKTNAFFSQSSFR